MDSNGRGGREHRDRGQDPELQLVVATTGAREPGQETPGTLPLQEVDVFAVERRAQQRLAERLAEAARQKRQQAQEAEEDRRAREKEERAAEAAAARRRAEAAQRASRVRAGVPCGSCCTPCAPMGTPAPDGNLYCRACWNHPEVRAWARGSAWPTTPTVPPPESLQCDECQQRIPPIMWTKLRGDDGKVYCVDCWARFDQTLALECGLHLRSQGGELPPPHGAQKPSMEDERPVASSLPFRTSGESGGSASRGVSETAAEAAVEPLGSASVGRDRPSWLNLFRQRQALAAHGAGGTFDSQKDGPSRRSASPTGNEEVNGNSTAPSVLMQVSAAAGRDKPSSLTLIRKKNALASRGAEDSQTPVDGAESGAAAEPDIASERVRSRASPERASFALDAMD